MKTHSLILAWGLALPVPLLAQNVDLLASVAPVLEKVEAVAEPTQSPLAKVGVSRNGNIYILRPLFEGKSGAKLEVKTPAGKTVILGRWRARDFRLDLSRLPKGFYFLHVTAREIDPQVLRVQVR